MQKLLWVKADWEEPWEKRKSFAQAAVEAGANAVLVKPEDVQKVLKLGAISVAASEPGPGVSVVVLSARSVDEVGRVFKQIEKLRKQEKKVATLVEISSKELERAAVKVGKAADFLIAVTPDWKVIPLENLIAELQRAEVKVLAGVKDASEAKVAVEALEIGAAGVLLDAREQGVEEVRKVRETFESLGAEKLELVPAKVTEVRPVGMGDR
ncbi:MAG: 3-dehydroquinate synthase II, partial [Hadesarchaea archaeon]|nr:3-dehydroquinate synthase II [Hadesarchaea archaeon]